MNWILLFFLRMQEDAAEGSGYPGILDPTRITTHRLHDLRLTSASTRELRIKTDRNILTLKIVK